jgi:hypothetical protein
MIKPLRSVSCLRTTEHHLNWTTGLTQSSSADIEWKLLYVGDAKSEEYDQELDSCMGEYSLSQTE